MKSAIYVVNTNDNAVSVGSNIPLGSAVHGFGCAIKLSNNSINLDSGYYSVASAFELTVATAGDVTISLVQDGTVITSATVQATADVPTAISLPTALIRVKKCCGSTLTWTLSTTASTITSSSVEVLSV